MLPTPTKNRVTAFVRPSLSQVLMFLLVLSALTIANAQSSGPASSGAAGMARDRDAACMMPPMPHPLHHHSGAEMGGPVMGPPPFFFELTQLGLDDKQQQSIRELSLRLAKDDVRRNAEMTVARMELVELARKTPMDIKAIEGKLKQISALDLKARLSHFKAMAEIESKLTPEQTRRLTSIRQAPCPDKRNPRPPHDGERRHPHAGEGSGE